MSNFGFKNFYDSCNERAQLVEVGTDFGCGINEALIRNAIDKLEIEDLKFKFKKAIEKNKSLQRRNKILDLANKVLKKKLLDQHAENIKIDKIG